MLHVWEPYTSVIRDGAPEGFQHLGCCLFLKIQRALFKSV
jgi:hypothetical protein